MARRMKDAVPTETELVVSALVNECGIKWSVVLIHTGIKRESWECDAWSFVVEKPDLGIHVSFDYYTGLGHRVIDDRDYRQVMERYGGRLYRDENGILRRTPLEGRAARILSHELERAAKPHAPHITSLLHAMLLDSQACDQSFASWCSDFGYNYDSRKAFDIYTACQENGDKLKKIVFRR